MICHSTVIIDYNISDNGTDYSGEKDAMSITIKLGPSYILCSAIGREGGGGKNHWQFQCMGGTCHPTTL